MEPKTIYKINERHRTNDGYNLFIIDEEVLSGEWEMPIIEMEDYIPDRLIGFNYAKSNKDKNCGIHFYLDDYQFERIWRSPQNYISVLKKYTCILSPDFSLYLDMPLPMKIWNIYRSRAIGRYYQKHGIKVIPTISWAEEKTYDFCFSGIPKNSIVSVSTLGVHRNKEALEIWKDGMTEMIKRIQPKVILIYGKKIDYNFEDIEVIYFQNEVIERMKTWVDVEQVVE